MQNLDCPPNYCKTQSVKILSFYYLKSVMFGDIRSSNGREFHRNNADQAKSVFPNPNNTCFELSDNQMIGSRSKA